MEKGQSVKRVWLAQRTETVVVDGCIVQSTAISLGIALANHAFLSFLGPCSSARVNIRNPS